MQSGFIYIIANKTDTVLYIGMTDNLARRLFEHKNKLYPNSFSSRYEINKLVYYEELPSLKLAAEKEVKLKKWNRQRKLNLIQLQNPKLEDLYQKIIDKYGNPEPKL